MVQYLEIHLGINGFCPETSIEGKKKVGEENRGGQMGEKNQVSKRKEQ